METVAVVAIVATAAIVTARAVGADLKKIIAPLILGCALLASAAPAYADSAEAATQGDAQLNQPAFNAIDELSRASDPGLAYPELRPSPEIRCTGC